MILHARVPAINGVPQVGLAKLIFGVSISDTEAMCEIEGELQAGWVEMPEEEYRALVPSPAPTNPQPTDLQILLGKITALEAKVDAMRGDVTAIRTNVVATKIL